MRREKLPAKRIRVLVAIMALWGAGIGVRLFFLQIVQSAYYVEKAEQQQRKIITITPRRGDILDREGNVLAGSVEVDSLFARPHEIKDLQRTAKTLSRLTGIPLRAMTRKLSSSEPWVWVKRKLLKSEKEAIERADLAASVSRKSTTAFIRGARWPHTCSDTWM